MRATLAEEERFKDTLTSPQERIVEVDLRAAFPAFRLEASRMVCTWHDRLSPRTVSGNFVDRDGRCPGPMFGIQHGILRVHWPTTPGERERLRARTTQGLLQGGRYGAVLGGAAGRPKGSPD